MKNQKVPARSAEQILHPNVDAFLSGRDKWSQEMAQLRMVLLDCQLREEWKWGKPCYTYEDNNVAIIQPFKEYCALMFFKGALLKDAYGMLVSPGENSQAGRQLRFTDAQQILVQESMLKAYIEQAIGVEKAGLKVSFKKSSEFAIPEELQQQLDQTPALKKAFVALTPGRQRAYLLYFSGAKQSQTRASRIEKCRERILSGKGLDD